MRNARPSAYLLLAYAVLCLAMALPSGSRLTNRAVWNSPLNQASFSAWAKGLSQVGIRVTPQQLQDHAWRVTRSYVAVQSLLLAPFWMLAPQLGFNQGWPMFSNPQTVPARLWVELDSGAGFEPLYVTGSAEHTWQRRFFEHHRIRKVVGRLNRDEVHADYEALGRWLARRAARQYPDARQLRLRLYTWRTQPATQAAAESVASSVEFGRPGGKFTRAKVFSLSEYRR